MRQFTSQTVVLASAIAIAGCADRRPDLACGTSTQCIRLEVNANGERPTAAYVYQLAREQFAKVMPLRAFGPYTEKLELTFRTDGKHCLLACNTPPKIYTSAWGPPGPTLLRSGSATPSMNSTMHADLTRNGRRVWSADCNTNSVFELPGWEPTVPEESALQCAKHLADKYIAYGDRDVAN